MEANTSFGCAVSRTFLFCKTPLGFLEFLGIPNDFALGFFKNFALGFFTCFNLIINLLRISQEPGIPDDQ